MLVWGFTAGVIAALLDMGGWARPWSHGPRRRAAADPRRRRRRSAGTAAADERPSRRAVP